MTFRGPYVAQLVTGQSIEVIRSANYRRKEGSHDSIPSVHAHGTNTVLTLTVVSAVHRTLSLR
jgi:hypothetical protein